MAWQGFLAQALFPKATRLRARWDDTVEAVLAAIPADATHFLFHISVTRSAGFPERRAELLSALAARGIKTINERATDISKPFTQALCASLGLPVALAARSMPADTPVIVKTSLNHGGKIERYLPPPVLSPRCMPSRAEGINPSLIKKTFGDVSSRTSRFVLVDGRYRPAPGSNAGSDAGPQALLDQLALFLPAIGLDFGTVDAMCDNEGRHYIVDVNSTPFFRSRAPDILDHLGGAQ